MQLRTTQCTVLRDGLNEMVVLDNARCVIDEKPVTLRRCKSKKPCHVNYYVSKWSEV